MKNCLLLKFYKKCPTAFKPRGASFVSNKNKSKQSYQNKQNARNDRPNIIWQMTKVVQFFSKYISNTQKYKLKNRNKKRKKKRTDPDNATTNTNTKAIQRKGNPQKESLFAIYRIRRI